jgi:hypothetical protein
VQQHLQRLDGVDKAEVSLRDGQVTVYPNPEGQVDPARILKATYDSGVSVAEMTVTAGGELQPSSAGLFFQVTKQQGFSVRPGPLADRLRPQAGTGSRVRLRGRVFQKPAGAAAPKNTPQLSQFEILEILEGSGP